MKRACATPGLLLAGGLTLLAQTATDSKASYVGSKACVGCHSAIYKSYFNTAMGKASGIVGPSGTGQPAPGSFLHAASGTEYRIRSSADGLYLEYQKASSDGPISGKRKLEYYIGSASHARGYVYREGGFLYQAPVCYYASRRGWDMAPGYETQPSIFLGRKIEQPCLDCHSSKLASGASSVVDDPPFTEGAVACERCHGPASEHLARFTPGQDHTGIGILNPVRLSPVERDSTCAQCHLTGEVRIQRLGTAVGLLRAGSKLTDQVVPFIWSSPDQKRLKVIGHFEGLALSQCKRRSGDKLWCGTCHDPHSVPEPEQRVAYFRAKCLTCHTEATCTASAAVRARKADDCTACHMPKSQAVDGLHAAFTDHSIIRNPESSLAGEATTLGNLVPFWPGTGTPRDLALAYADVAWRSHAESDYRRAFQYLKRALPDAQSDPDILAGLGFLYDLSGNQAEAGELYRRALAANPNNLTALTNLAQHEAGSGNTLNAIQLSQRAVRNDPGLATPGLNLARLLLVVNDFASANKAIQDVLQFNPDSQKALSLQHSIQKEGSAVKRSPQ